jgi:hypothetical protein
MEMEGQELTCAPQDIDSILDDLAAPVERIGLLRGPCWDVLGRQFEWSGWEAWRRDYLHCKRRCDGGSQNRLHAHEIQ